MTRWLALVVLAVAATLAQPARAYDYQPPEYADAVVALPPCQQAWNAAMNYLQAAGRTYRASESNNCTKMQPLLSQYARRGMIGAYVCNVTELKPDGTYSGLNPCDSYNGFAINGGQVKNGGNTFYWYAAEGTQCPSGEWPDPTKPGQCLNQQKCLARNADLGSSPFRVSGTPFQACYDVGGCAFGPVGKVGHTTATWGGKTTNTYVAEVGYSGNQGGSCSAGVQPADDQKPDAPPTEKCTKDGDITHCVKPDGRECVAGPSGKKFCYAKGETGTKTDGPDLAKRDAGQQPIAPNLQLPNGDQLVKKGDTVTTTTTTTNVTNNTSTTVTTVTAIYGTTNGTNASGGTDGKQADGNTNDGKDDGDKNGVTGGSCEQGYTTTGDPLLGSILKEEHKQRCADEKNDSDMRSDAQAFADAAGTDEGTPGDVFANNGQPGTISRTLVILGSRACPAFPEYQIAPGVILKRPAAFCDIGAAIGLLFVAAAYAWGIGAVVRA